MWAGAEIVSSGTRLWIHEKDANSEMDRTAFNGFLLTPGTNGCVRLQRVL